MASPSPNQFRLSPSPSVATAAPNQPDLLQQLNAALQGGTPVYNFFKTYSQTLQTFYQTIATSDDTIWLDGTDENGNPVKYVQIGNNYLTISGNITDTTPIQNGTGKGDYQPVGVAVATLTLDDGTTHQLTLHAIEYSGYGTGGVVVTAAIISQILAYTNTTLKSYISGVAKACLEVVGEKGVLPPDEADDDVEYVIDGVPQNATGIDPWLLEGGSEFAIDGGAAAGFIGGAAIIVIMGLLQVLSANLYNYVAFYNVTNEDIQFGICSTPGGDVFCKGPAAVGQTATIAKVGPAQTPPGIISSDAIITYSFLSFNNTDPLGGIEYVLEATASGDFPGFRIAVYITGIANCELYIAFTNDDCNTFWNQFIPSDPGQQGTASQTLTMTATSGKYTLSIALNQLTGQSSSPFDGTEGYNFEHLIVLTDGSIPLS